MKNFMMAIAVFIVAFGFAAITMAEAPVKNKGTKMSGEVTSVDQTAKTFTLRGKDKGKDKEVTLMVTDKTLISMGKEKMTLADIHSGTKLSAIYVADGDKMTAKSIHLAKKK